MSRALPQNLDAERALIGCALIGPSAVSDGRTFVRPEDFAGVMERRAWESILAIVDRGQPLDVLTLADEMRPSGTTLKDAEIGQYLMACAGAGGIAEHAPRYAKIVREHADRRQFILLCQEQASRAYSGEASLLELLNDTSAGVMGIATGRPDDSVPLEQTVTEALNAIEARAEKAREGGVLGVRFGVWAIDQLILGVRHGEQCVVAGSPGGGKSALAMQAALECVIADGGTALALSMEMPRLTIGERAISYFAGIESDVIRSGNLSVDAWKAALDVRKKLRSGFFVDDTRTDFATAAAKVRRWRARNPPPRLGAFLVDFVQLVKVLLARGASRAEAVGEIAYGCKALAKDTESAAILVAQLNRSAAQEKDPPDLHHLKDSSGIEQSADQVMFIHNPNRIEEGDIDVLVRKNRNGPKRQTTVRWSGRNYRFRDVERDHPDYHEAYDR